MGTYGLVTGEPALVASEGAFAVGSLIVVSRLLPLRRTVAWAAACALLVVSAYAALGAGPCLVASSAASVTMRLMQVRSVVRAGTAAGVSVSTWLVLAASNGAWSLNGALRGNGFFAWSAAASGLASLTVVGTCVVVTRRNA